MMKMVLFVITWILTPEEIQKTITDMEIIIRKDHHYDFRFTDQYTYDLIKINQHITYGNTSLFTLQLMKK